ncbi:hypothetical protein tloyanaT_26360 [Thalassotalea loyana]|uniref:Uncharacterized protein n=1 Tax=Thalassotalea loyana TaxID=280483 RepID=A0ABQ6HE74_9GAMM|nr:hypothetical protein [Thalassotalea loyana]GLX86383.1 hypothetical protein tloyanaT_26360 [Thalassotalea loyana]
MPIFKVFQQLLGYVLIGLPMSLLMLPSLIAFNRSTHIKRSWLALDIFIATLAHGTLRRTISGLTGERMHKQKRYYYQALVIDFLAKLVGDGPNHCYRAYLWEQRQGLVNA